MISLQNLRPTKPPLRRWRAKSAVFAVVAAAVLVLAGCGSNTQPFNDTPAVQNLFPTNATAGGAAFTLNISGTGFIASSTAFWNNTQLTTTFNANTLQISASIPASFIASPGVAQVTVVSPTPGGGVSNAATFTINAPSNPTPTVTTLNPSSTPLNVLPAGGVLLVNGTNFVQSSAAAFNGVARATTFISSTQLSVPVTASDVSTNSTLSVTVSNPAPGGGVSNTASFVVGLGHNARLKSSVVPSGANVPEVVSVNASGGSSNGRSSAPAISADGRFVAFYSSATNLTANGATGNIFVRDTCLGAADCTPQTIAVDVAPDGSSPDGAADPHVAISADGRFVAFASSATNLVAGTTLPSGAGSQVYLRDLCVGSNAPSGCVPSTQLVSLDAAGAEAANSVAPSISADGRFIAFVSDGKALVRDTCAGAASSPCVGMTFSVGAHPGLSGSEELSAPVISATGRYVAFAASESASSNASQVLLADICLGTGVTDSCRPAVQKISISADGYDMAGVNQAPSVSADGRFVAFQTQNGDGTSQVLLRDTCLGGSAPDSCAAATILIAANASAPSISADGRYISYTSATSGATGLSVYDTCYQAPAACSVGAFALPFVPDSDIPAPISSDGSAIVLSSRAAIASLPLSGQGDVLLLALPF